MMGVYAIYQAQQRAIYIGSTMFLTQRPACHRWALRRGMHENRKLQADWLALGEATFTFHCLETVRTSQDLAMREQYWIDRYVGLQGYRLYNARRHARRPPVLKVDEHYDDVGRRLTSSFYRTSAP